MSDASESNREAMERAREHIDWWRDLAESDLPIAPYADELVSVVEEEYKNG